MDLVSGALVVKKVSTILAFGEQQAMLIGFGLAVASRVALMT